MFHKISILKIFTKILGKQAWSNLATLLKQKSVTGVLRWNFGEFFETALLQKASRFFTSECKLFRIALKEFNDFYERKSIKICKEICHKIELQSMRQKCCSEKFRKIHRIAGCKL